MALYCWGACSVGAAGDLVGGGGEEGADGDGGLGGDLVGGDVFVGDEDEID
mgnify:FL=1